MAEGDEQPVRLVFEQGGSVEETETVWGMAQGRDGRFRVLNIPLFAFGVGRGDVVEAEGSEVPLVVTRIVERGGHSTYRVAIAPERVTHGRELLRRLREDRGCAIEQLSPTFVAIDVPPASDIDAVCEALEAGMASGVWTFDELHCGHPVE